MNLAISNLQLVISKVTKKLFSNFYFLISATEGSV